jgi:hypothetical protein
MSGVGGDDGGGEVESGDAATLRRAPGTTEGPDYREGVIAPRVLMVAFRMLGQRSRPHGARTGDCVLALPDVAALVAECGAQPRLRGAVALDRCEGLLAWPAYRGADPQSNRASRQVRVHDGGWLPQWNALGTRLCAPVDWGKDTLIGTNKGLAALFDPAHGTELAVDDARWTALAAALDRLGHYVEGVCRAASAPPSVERRGRCRPQTDEPTTAGGRSENHSARVTASEAAHGVAAPKTASASRRARATRVGAAAASTGQRSSPVGRVSRKDDDCDAEEDASSTGTPDAAGAGDGDDGEGKGSERRAAASLRTVTSRTRSCRSAAPKRAPPC